MKTDRKHLLKCVELLHSLAGKVGHITLTNDSICAVDGGIKVVLNVKYEDQEVFEHSTVKAEPLLEAMKKATSDAVELDVTDDCVTLKFGRSRFKLRKYDTHDSGNAAGIGDAFETIEMRTEPFERLINRVGYATAGATETSRPALNGVYLHTEGGKLIAVATDGLRLARYAVGVGASADVALTIGNNAISMIRKFLDFEKPDGPMALYIGVSKALLKTPYGSTRTTLIDAEFPDYKSIMPEIVAPLDLDTIQLSESMTRLLLVAPDTKEVRALFDGGEIVLRADSYRGSGEEVIQFEGEPKTRMCAFNGKFMKAAIGQCECLVEFNDSTPIVLRGQVDDEYIAVVMPIRMGINP